MRISRYHWTGLLAATAVMGGLAAPAAFADTIIRTPNPSDMYDLDHHYVYTWRVDNLNLANQTITGASISFDNIRNWDRNDNRLFLWMFDTAKNPGVASFVDDPSFSAPVRDITDDFANNRYHNRNNWLIANGTDGTKLTDKKFGTSAVDWTYNFTSSQVSLLSTYLANGNNVAFGFDPDCHYYNDGIKLKITTKPADHVIPEPGTIALVAAGSLPLAGAVIRRRRSA